MAKSECDNCDKLCKFHERVAVKNDEQDTRLKELETLVHDAVPRMQARVNLLIQILVAGLVLLISISGFSFLQLLDFKKTYAQDKQKHWEQTLEQERRYLDLFDKLSDRVTGIEAKQQTRFINDSKIK